MYKITYQNNSTSLISDEKGEKIELLKSTRMLNSRQLLWLKTVKRIEKLRDEPNAHTLHLTKDMTDSNCPKCSKLSR